ncbi:hypothetical protein GH714_004283 [Hevea brasiliensis]|uniref:Retrovirus-related Pol polyprotein from transposon TNT 1-94-like beta-barrel domain-containing protein n=1 Tax=Hevea brasiliensis TaxID=3981 RepID=A0A6A6KBE5_HEVBR|nr:hypothetical protein GH714_004283 [Hevea brasiliensis]
MSDDKTLTKIPHFDGHYDHWSELMENLLRAKGLWNLVEKGFTEPTEREKLTEAQQAELNDARTKDYQVKHYLFQAIDRTVFEQILDRRTSKIVWDSLKRKFGGNQKVKKSLLNALRRDFEVLEMKNEETITEYFARVMLVANKMRSNGEEMPDKKIVEKILRTLTDKFTYVVVSIEESKDTDTMSIDELQSSLVYECPQKNEANYAELDEEDELLLMAYVEQHEANRNDAWFLDSGCSNHMVGDEHMFSSLDTTFRHSVKLGNNTRMEVSGIGSVKIVLQGNCYTVEDVFWAPELKNNLLSVGQLQEKGGAVLFKNGTCSVFHPQKGKIAESIMSANRMFILLAEMSKARMMFVEDKKWEWEKYDKEADLIWEESIEIPGKEETQTSTGTVENSKESAAISAESTATTSTNESESALREGRTRRPPIWTTDYVTGEDNGPIL